MEFIVVLDAIASASVYTHQSQRVGNPTGQSSTRHPPIQTSKKKKKRQTSWVYLNRKLAQDAAQCVACERCDLEGNACSQSVFSQKHVNSQCQVSPQFKIRIVIQFQWVLQSK